MKEKSFEQKALLKNLEKVSCVTYVHQSVEAIDIKAKKKSNKNINEKKSAAKQCG